MPTIDELESYIAGIKLATREDLILNNEALEKGKENCKVLIIPRSKWDEWKQEMP